MEPNRADRVQSVIESAHSSDAPFDPSWRVVEEEVARIVEAARSAPSAIGRQVLHLVVVDDPGVLAQLSLARPAAVAGAPLVIVVLYDPMKCARDQLGLIDLGCVMENMWLMGQAERLDVQVIGSFVGDGVEDTIKRVLAVPPPWRIAFAMRFGHVTSRQPPEAPEPAPHLFVGHNRF